jgi:hypothetical protein
MMNRPLDQDEGLINCTRLVLSRLCRQGEARCFAPRILFTTLVPAVSGQVAYKSCPIPRSRPRKPTMRARRGYERLKPPYWLILSTSAGLLMLNASRQMLVKYSTSMTRGISGSWSCGTPDPDWMYPHSVLAIWSTNIPKSFSRRNLPVLIRPAQRILVVVTLVSILGSRCIGVAEAGILC